MVALQDNHQEVIAQAVSLRDTLKQCLKEATFKGLHSNQGGITLTGVP